MRFENTLHTQKSSSQMLNILFFLGKKFLRFILLLFAVTVICFTLMKFSPIDPIQAYIGGEQGTLPPEQIENLREYWGLNDGFFERYVKWISGLLSGNMGTSIVYNQPVKDVIMEKFSASLLLMGTAWVISGVLGFLMGIIGALNKGKLIDKIIKMYCLTLASAPIFWVGILLLIVFSIQLGWFPMGLSAPIHSTITETSWGDRIYHLILPALTLSVTGVGSIALHTRQKFIDVLNSDYIQFAKARGESNWLIVKRHGLKNIMLPAITLQFSSIAELFAGSTLAETIFSYPGLGNAIVEAGTRADLPLLVGIALFATTFVYTGNFIANVMYTLIDPRIKEGINRGH